MTAPNPLWYATRGLGVVMLVVLTAVVVLGVAGIQRWRSDDWPSFLTLGLHRNLSLLAVALLPLHAGAVMLDSFAGLGWKDILVPFATDYRPLWLGAGVLSGELLLALVATSLVRHWLNPRLWRATHWAAYAAWPFAMLHGLGTGSDTRAAWAVFLYLLCGLAVLVAVLARLFRGRPETLERRLVATGAVIAAAGVAMGWAINGPLRPGWAAAAGTPARLLASARAGQAATSAPQPSPSLPAGVPTGLDDRLRGTVASAGATGARVVLFDRSNAALEVIVDIPDPNAASGTLEILQSGHVICSTTATFDQQVSAVCGQTGVQIVLQALDDSRVGGQLVTQGAT